MAVIKNQHRDRTRTKRLEHRRHLERRRRLASGKRAELAAKNNRPLARVRAGRPARHTGLLPGHPGSGMVAVVALAGLVSLASVAFASGRVPDAAAAAAAIAATATTALTTPTTNIAGWISGVSGAVSASAAVAAYIHPRAATANGVDKQIDPVIIKDAILAVLQGMCTMARHHIKLLSSVDEAVAVGFLDDAIELDHAVVEATTRARMAADTLSSSEPGSANAEAILAEVSLLEVLRCQLSGLVTHLKKARDGAVVPRPEGAD